VTKILKFLAMKNYLGLDLKRKEIKNNLSFTSFYYFAVAAFINALNKGCGDATVLLYSG